MENTVSLFYIGKKLRSSGDHNLTQNIVEKFTKLSEIGFPIECFTADFSLFSSTIVKCLLDAWMGTHYQFRNFRNFLMSYIHFW